MPNGTTLACRLTVLAVALVAAPAMPESPPVPSAPAKPPAPGAEPPTALDDVMRLMVAKGYIAQVHADALAGEEKSDPARAVVQLARVLWVRGHLQPAGAEAVTALVASPGGGASARALAELVRVLLETQEITSAELDALQTQDGVRRVTYVPELIRAQIRDQVKRDVLEQMQQEGWAQPKAFPEWTRHLTFRGDVRTRYERVLFKKGNATQPDWNAINNGGPFDMVGVDQTNDRYLDTDRDRSRARLRARLGLEAEVSRSVMAVLRLASGDGSSPVSTNQTLGGSAGNFSKYQFWLDRAAIRWTLVKAPADTVALDLGRFANPFFATDLVWDEDVNLDGVALEADSRLAGPVSGFLTAGAFPVYNTAFAFPADHEEKGKSWDKWLLAAQLGAEYRPGERLGLKGGAALYSFRNVEGRQSSPCDTNIKTVSCDTDITRPSFAQNGNTYRTLRTPSDAARAAEVAGGPEYQYFGLASSFRELAVTARLDLRVRSSLQLTADGEWVRNLAFRPKVLGEDIPLNNRKACSADLCPYGGGNMGYTARLTLGTPTTGKRWDWSAWVGYKHLESDAVLDAFTDSDFGLGGTNLKGFVAGVSVSPADNLIVAVRWYSANQIVGPQYGVDLLQLDLGARY